ncbi:MAG: adenylate/guanylate cyclase domain-containing protein [Ramlibacter sp.]|nr:adenylate/guanylate cyclase domain-containing protein [Ramlibacter sp.]
MASVGIMAFTPWRLRLAAVFIALVVWGGLALIAPSAFLQADERATDLVWRLQADKTPERRVIVVDVDDASVARVGPWPWPRQTQAQLVDKLREYGVALQMHDLVYADERPGTADLAGALARSQAAAPAVVAQVFALNNESRQTSGQLAGALPGQACMPPAAPARGYVANSGLLGIPAGHITPRIDPDGTVRKVPAIVCFDQRNYPTLTIAGLLALDSAGSTTPLRAEPGRGPWDPAWMVTLGSSFDLQIPLDRNGDIRVPYHKDRTAITSISAADVLEGRVESPELLKGAWVLIGASAFGLGDTVPTAQGGAVSGVEVHAQLLTAMLDRNIPLTPQGAPMVQLAWALAAALALLALSWTRPKSVTPGGRKVSSRVLWIPVVSLVLAACGFVLHAGVLVFQGWWLGWAHAALAIAFIGLSLGLAEHARSLAEQGRLFRNLSSYLPASVAEKIAMVEPTGEIEAERREVTVVVADVRNFSAYCEARSPEDAARVLHRFYTTASAIVASYGGAVEEMVGDSLIAVFNGSRPCADHTVQGIDAARELWLRCSEELPNLPPQGLEPLALGVGVESGIALLGSFGPAQRRVHSVLGQVVTMAIRLQDLTEELACPVLVGAQAAERIGVPFERTELVLKPLGSFLLPGLRHSSKVFTLRTLMQPGGDAERQSLRYLKQQSQPMV